MIKELYVSTTPHETKVGITEDDQLAEIYLERDNEYTLAGSIYKGRVTRVLPGMQSAFVDIGLERDAFLYVSDFMDLEQQDEDLDEAIPANRPVTDARMHSPLEASGPALAGDLAPSGNVTADGGAGVLASERPHPATGAERDFRGRRRRRGRRGEIGERGGRPPQADRGVIRPEPLADVGNESAGEVRSESRPEPRNDTRAEPRNDTRNETRNDRFQRGDRGGRGASESRFQRPAPAARPGRDYDYGPPPGYQPIVLPGESISKYQRQNVTEGSSPAASTGQSRVEAREVEPLEIPLAKSFGHISAFPEDEPNFAVEAEPLRERHEHAALAEAHEAEFTEVISPFVPIETPSPAHEPASRARTEAPYIAPFRENFSENTDEAGLGASAHAHEVAANAMRMQMPTHMQMEEQEIEEDEVDLAPYGEEAGDDEEFEEVEEESQAAGLLLPEAGRAEIAPEVGAVSDAATAGDVAVTGEAVLEAEEREAVELELEEAQAEAEALLEAEAIGGGTVDASAAVRGPAPEAMLLQRTQRTTPGRGPDRGPDRGRGRRGGRRFRSRENHVVPQISELLKEGQEVLIQIAKEPIGKKGARITSHIALPGRFLVFMPTVNHTGVSRKIASEEERLRLKRIIQSERENGGGGFIVRTAAAGASDDELRADIRFLKNLWNEIKTRSDSAKSPSLIYHDLNVVERVLRDQVSSDFSVIWVDTEQEYERIVRFANRFQPALVKRVKLYTKETPLYDQFGLNEEINKALKSKVWLKSGGYIVINQTEALVAIDVNTGKYVGKTTRLEDTIVKTNVDAIKEIVRQVRLRDLGGIIIIDFIDMDERRNRQKVMQALEEALRFDRAPSKVLQFNDFGLVAITRKRVKQSLERTIGTPCPYCQSTGFVKSVNTVCNEIYVEMRKINSHLDHSDVMLRVNPEVAKALKVDNAKLLNEMEELTKKTIIVKSDPALHQEQFDIH